jgi:hypothetical protein
MRPRDSLLALALLAPLASLAPPALRAQAVPIRFSFDGAQPPVGSAATVISRRQKMQAWQDTVQVYLEQGAPRANVALATERQRANYRVSIVAMPVPLVSDDAVTMAVVIFEPDAAGSWRYLTHYVAFSRSAQEAAGELLRQTLESIGEAGVRRE